MVEWGSRGGGVGSRGWCASGVVRVGHIGGRGLRGDVHGGGCGVMGLQGWWRWGSRGVGGPRGGLG